MISMGFDGEPSNQTPLLVNLIAMKFGAEPAILTLTSTVDTQPSLFNITNVWNYVNSVFDKYDKNRKVSER